MIYNEIGDLGVEVSAIALGGHEYLPDGSSRGFNEDREAAVAPGVNVEGFGGPQRRALVRAALDAGVTLFDATIDEEKEALGRNLDELDAGEDVLVQTRPAGICYTYEEYNRSMTDYEALRGEVERILGLLRRERLDLLNLGFERAALDHDPDFLSTVAENVHRLKEEDLIRLANADTTSGAELYLEAIESGAFDLINLNFNVGLAHLAEEVLPAAADAGMGVVTREAFLKGGLFDAAAEADVDPDRATRAAIRWNLSHEAVTTVIIGADDAGEFERNLAAVEEPGLTAEDERVLDALRETEAYAAVVG